MRHHLLLAALALFVAPSVAQAAQPVYAQQAQAPAYSNESPYDRAFRAADVNRDGRLTGDENEAFSRYRREYRNASSGQAGAPAVRRDYNNDGVITTQEREYYRAQRRAYWKQVREQRRLERQQRHHTRTYTPRRSSSRSRSVF